MKGPTLRRVAVIAAWLVAAAGALGLVAAALLGATPGLVSVGFAAVFLALASAIVASASVGALLVLRRPGNILGPLLMAGAILIAVTFLGFIEAAALAAARGPADVLAAIAALIGGLGITTSIIVAGAAPALVFPDGRLPSRRWQWPVGGLVVAIVLASVPSLVRPGPLGSDLAVNPFGVSGVAWVDALLAIADLADAVAIPAALLMAVVAVIVRFRRSVGAERQQLKWFVGANVLVAVFLMLSIADGGGEPTLFDVLAVMSLGLPSVAIGVAVLRYRLYEIDRIISRTLSYAAMTGLLAMVFVGAVLGLTTLLGQLAGGGTIAVAAATLLVAALFQPLRLRVQRAVDRRFDRARYDGERTVADFAARMRDEVDLGRIESALVRAVDEAVRPSTERVWLRVPSTERR